MPYDVIQPLWSDGSEKRRWIAIPNDGTPNTAAERIGCRGWELDLPERHRPDQALRISGAPLETRFLVRGDDAIWYGFTYRGG